MKCKVCGSESGKYPLCRACNIKKEQGKIIKCTICNNWHYINESCPAPIINSNDTPYLYEVRRTLISKTEQGFYRAILDSVPEDYCVFPQMNLSAIIERTDDFPYRNELYRIVDFLITDASYMPKLIVEINDCTHLSYDRKERDEKVQKICEEAGIPILCLWTSYGVNVEYIRNKINEILSGPPMPRRHHFSQSPVSVSNNTNDNFKEDINNTDNSATSVYRKKKKVALALCVLSFFGIGGLHRFYVGKDGSGVLHFFTLGLLGVGTLVDLISICSNKFTDKYGQPLA